MKTLMSAGDQLMGIALMADIPDQFIDRGIENVVQGQGQFDHPETGTKMSTGMGG